MMVNLLDIGTVVEFHPFSSDLIGLLVENKSGGLSILNTNINNQMSYHGVLCYQVGRKGGLYCFIDSDKTNSWLKFYNGWIEYEQRNSHTRTILHSRSPIHWSQYKGKILH